LQKIVGLCNKSTLCTPFNADKLYRCGVDDDAVVMTFNKKNVSHELVKLKQQLRRSTENGFSTLSQQAKRVIKSAFD